MNPFPSYDEWYASTHGSTPKQNKNTNSAPAYKPKESTSEAFPSYDEWYSDTHGGLPSYAAQKKDENFFKPMELETSSEEINLKKYSPEKFKEPIEKDEKGYYTSQKRKEIMAELEELRSSSGYAVTEEHVNMIRKREAKLREELHKEDARLGNAKKYYSPEEKISAFLNGSFEGGVKGYRSDMASAAGTMQAFGNELHRISSDEDRAIADSGYSGYATDPFAASIIAQGGKTPNDGTRGDGGLATYEAEADRQIAKSDRLAKEAAVAIEDAKSGFGKFGQAAVDIGANLVQMGMDGALRATGAGMVPLFARAAGGASREARDAGANIYEQVGYGVTRGATEVFTEKLFDGLAGIYGSGILDKVKPVKKMVQAVVKRLNDHPIGRKFIGATVNALGEGFEEVISDALQPLAQKIYSDRAYAELWNEAADQMFYDFLIGTAIGSMGGAVDIVRSGVIPKTIAAKKQAAEYEAQVRERENAVKEIEQKFRDRTLTQEEFDNLTVRVFKGYEKPEEHHGFKNAREEHHAYKNKVEEEYLEFQKEDGSVNEEFLEAELNVLDYISKLEENNDKTNKESLKSAKIPRFEAIAMAMKESGKYTDLQIYDETGVHPSTFVLNENPNVREIVQWDKKKSPPKDPSLAIKGEDEISKNIKTIVHQAFVERKERYWDVRNGRVKNANDPNEYLEWLKDFNKRVANPLGYNLENDGLIIDRKTQNVRWADKEVIFEDRYHEDWRSGKWKDDRGFLAPLSAKEITEGNEHRRAEYSYMPLEEQPHFNRTKQINYEGTNDIDVDKYTPDELFEEVYARGLLNADDVRLKKLTDPVLEKLLESKTVSSNKNLSSKFYNEFNKRTRAKKNAELKLEKERAERARQKKEASEKKAAEKQKQKELAETDGTPEYFNSLRKRVKDSYKAEMWRARNQAEKKLGIKVSPDGKTFVYKATGEVIPENSSNKNLRMLRNAAEQLINEGKQKVYDDVRKIYEETGYVVKENGTIENPETGEVVFDGTRPPEAEYKPVEKEEVTQKEIPEVKATEVKEKPSESLNMERNLTPTEKSFSSSNFPVKNKDVTRKNSSAGINNAVEQAHREEAKWNNGVAENEHFVMEEGKVRAAAKERLDAIGVDEELDRILSLNEKDFEPIDIVEANTLLEILKSRSENYSLNSKFRDKRIVETDAENIAALEGKINKVKSPTGQLLHFARVDATDPATRINARANKVLSPKGEKAYGPTSPNGKNAQTIRNVRDFTNRIAYAADNDSSEMINIIKDISEYRGTNLVLKGKLNERVSEMLDIVSEMDGGYEFLKNLAYAQADAIITDKVSGMRGSVLEGIKSFRITNLLSGMKSWDNNYGNNLASVVTGSANQNLGLVFDELLSKASGTKTIGKDSSWKRTDDVKVAQKEALIKSLLNVMFDVNVDTETGELLTADEFDAKYETSGGNWFKMSGGTIERILAQYQMLIRATMVVPDEISKARIKAGSSISEEATPEAKAALKGDAEAQAKYRTFQNKGAIAGIVNKLRDKANTIKITDKKGGSLGIGDIFAVFATVPSNVAGHKLENSPVGWVKSFLELGVGLHSAKKGELTAQEQAKISRNCGRALGGMGLAFMGAFGAALGALGNTDFDNDEERKKLLKDNGVEGLYFNLTGLTRGIQGENASYQPGDLVIDLDWLEILSMPIGLGVGAYQDSLEGDSLGVAFGNAMQYSIMNTAETIMSLPGMDAIKKFYQGFKYSDEDVSFGAKILDAALPSLASNASAFVAPNMITQIGSGIDNKVRDVYTTDNPWQTAGNVLLERSGIFRGLVPEKKDSFGRTITYGGVQNRALLPGAIRKTTDTQVERELNRLSLNGYDNIYPNKSAPRNLEYSEGDSHKLSAEQRRNYTESYGQSLFDSYDKLIQSKLYNKLSDSGKAEAFKMLNSYAVKDANNEVYEEMGLEPKEMLGWMKLSPDERVQYVIGKQLINDVYAIQDGQYRVKDFKALDKFVASEDFRSMNSNAKKALFETYTRLDDIAEASAKGINSFDYLTAYNAMREIADRDGSSTQKAIDLKIATSKVAKTPEQEKWLNENLKIWTTLPASTSGYDKIVSNGFSTNKAKALYNHLNELEPFGDHAEATASQKYHEIANMNNLSETEKWNLFEAIGSEKAIARARKARDASGNSISYADWIKSDKYYKIK